MRNEVMHAFRIESFKMITAIVAATTGIASYQPAQAAPLNTFGRVSNVYVSDTATFGATNNFTLAGVSSLGNCGGFFGQVVFRIKDDLHGQQMFAQALAAATGGNTIFVNVDDAVRDSQGYCFVTGISFVAS